MEFIDIAGVNPSTVTNKLDFAINHIKLVRPNERIVDSYLMDDKPVIVAIDNTHCVWRYIFIFDNTIMYSLELF